MMLLVALLVSQTVDAPPSIAIRKTADGFRADVPAFDISWEAKVNGEIEREAATLCGERKIKWGKFGSTAKIEKDPANGRPEISGFFKEFSCVVAREPVVANLPSSWRAAPADDADVRRFFETYYAKRDGGQFEAAFTMFEPGARPEDSTQAGLREFNRNLGTGSRRITGVTWYVNPASAPRLGAYAALDFVGEYTGVHLYCGYLVLYRLGSGSYEIVREEQNTFNKSSEPVDPAQLEQMRAAACRGN